MTVDQGRNGVNAAASDPEDRKMGWKPLGDGRERWWQGNQWSESYRVPGWDRQRAIDHLVGLSFQVASEFCVGPAENDALREETTAALRALGVTVQEYPGD